MIFNKVKKILFHRFKFKKNKLVIFLWAFFSLNLTLYLSNFYGLKRFAEFSKSFNLTTSFLNNQDLINFLSSSYNESASSQVFLRGVTILSFISIFFLIEVVCIFIFFKKWQWKFKKILKKMAILIAFQLMLTAPIAILNRSQSEAVSSLNTQAQQEINQMIVSIQQEGDLNLVYKNKDIVTKISNEETPYITSGKYEQEALINHLGLEKEDTFYKAVLIPSLIRGKTDIDLKHNVILFPNNTISISQKLPMKDLQDILFVIAKKELEKSQLNQYVSSKKEPEFTFLTEEEYNEIENRKLQERKDFFEKGITLAIKNINDNNNYIKLAESTITQLKIDKTAYEARVRPILINCQSEIGRENCLEVERIINNVIHDYDVEISQSEEYLNQAKDFIPKLNWYYSNIKRSYENFLAYPIIPEIQSGSFQPPNNISIKYMDEENISASTYFYTIVHELIHYYSYDSDNDIPTFIEEGVTDYLTNKIAKEKADPSENEGGYPQEIMIAGGVNNLIGEDNLIELYFGKSYKNWEKEINNKCGKGCFKELVEIGDQITYTDIDDLDSRMKLLNSAVVLLNPKDSTNSANLQL